MLAALAAIFGLGCGEPDTEAQRWVEDGAQLVDVRSVGEYTQGHLRDSVNIPVGSIGARIAEIDGTRPVVVYCQSGIRSASAARTLRAAGLEVHDLGAMSNWPVQGDIVQ